MLGEVLQINDVHVLIPIHVSGKTFTSKDELQGLIMGLPDTVGRLSTSVRGFFDLCFYSEAREQFVDGKKTRTWLLNTISALGGIWKATDKTGKLDAEMPNDFGAIYKKIIGEEVEDKKVQQVR